MNAIQIQNRALKIAGCAWTDRERVGTLGDQLRAVAAMPSRGGEFELSDADRAELIRLGHIADSTLRRHEDLGSAE